MRLSWIIAAGVAVAAYSPPARRWYLTWGATPEEATGPLAGDELLLEPDLQSTRAVTVDAPPAAVWPWLVQMGSGRGGAYTYDWIENLLGLGMHSADEILPRFQHLAVGDVLPLGPDGPGMRVEICEPEQTLSFRSEDGDWVWTFRLHPEGAYTRLVSRNRIAAPTASWPARIVTRLVMEPGSLIMERRMLLGIKERAERTVPPSEQTAVRRETSGLSRRDGSGDG
ncbi:SRPBCC family protein [Actinoplanes sp. NEAU-A12]|uniref:SRPBCC family protein n=1 Tax=Actinoplanes sandaracinus TaxID=3045177 RepID=A0ABT6WG92_9ACTN|nr:SRPBCC family protein [Actinoplanes sandaracinus]MDI6098739.1 SRPBCC family protein [Actinoplanes sandaracinus]